MHNLLGGPATIRGQYRATGTQRLSYNQAKHFKVNGRQYQYVNSCVDLLHLVSCEGTVQIQPGGIAQAIQVALPGCLISGVGGSAVDMKFGLPARIQQGHSLQQNVKALGVIDAPDKAEADWPRVEALYRRHLDRVNPVVHYAKPGRFDPRSCQGCAHCRGWRYDPLSILEIAGKAHQLLLNLPGYPQHPPQVTQGIAGREKAAE